jgi:hypothetical protein
VSHAPHASPTAYPGEHEVSTVQYENASARRSPVSRSDAESAPRSAMALTSSAGGSADMTGSAMRSAFVLRVRPPVVMFGPYEKGAVPRYEPYGKPKSTTK